MLITLGSFSMLRDGFYANPSAPIKMGMEWSLGAMMIFTDIAFVTMLVAMPRRRKYVHCSSSGPIIDI
jgi:hypothetical protein